jgi:hypothetical protein
MNQTQRDFLIATLCGLGVLGFLLYGVLHMGGAQQKASTNVLTGEVVGKKFTPGPEQQISFGRQGLKSESFAGEFVLEVRVKSEDRTFEVPVSENTYQTTRLGSTFSFQRPRSEQLK